MGLDQYCFWVDEEHVVDDFNIKDSRLAKEFEYWGKYSSLQNWMQNLYEKKCYEQSKPVNEFNCIYLRLTEEDLHRFKVDVESKNMKWIGGFFFGDEYDYDDECAKRDLEFYESAMGQIQQGKAVYYYSWW